MSEVLRRSAAFENDDIAADYSPQIHLPLHEAARDIQVKSKPSFDVTIPP
jgi:hypothetical protein